MAQTVRGAADPARQEPGSHIVSAQLDNGLVVAQREVETKGNELTALRNLLPRMALQDTVVTVDAAGCYRDVAQTIISQGGDYLLAVKDNQPRLLAALKQAFASLDRAKGKGIPHDREVSVTRAHGRHERRTCTVLAVDRSILDRLDPARPWPGLTTVIRVVGQRSLRGQARSASRYYISSLPLTTGAKRLAQLVRGHWHIEDNLQWVLDDTFQEDRSRLRRGWAARNKAALRRMALNILTILQIKYWPKVSIRRLRKMMAHNPAQLGLIMA